MKIYIGIRTILHSPGAVHNLNKSTLLYFNLKTVQIRIIQNVSMNLQFCSMMMQRSCQLTQEAGQSFRKMHSQHFSHWSGYLHYLPLPHKDRAQF